MMPGLAMHRAYAQPGGGYRQSCKVCWQPHRLNFDVPDAIWAAVVPEHHRDLVVCLDCFDAFAAERKVAYADYLTELYFAGDAATLRLEVADA